MAQGLKDYHETGFSHGYADFWRNKQSRFVSDDQGVFELRLNYCDRIAIQDPERVAYARGYIEGFMKAESDNH